MASFSSGVQLGIGKVFIFVTNIRLYNAVQIDPCMRLFFPSISLLCIVYIMHDINQL